MKPLVSVRRIQSYSACAPQLALALKECGLLEGVAGKRILLKPNMMRAAPPERAESTHPLFLAALTRLLVEQGAEVLVGDSSGILGFTQEVFEASGVAAQVQAAGGRIVNFDAGPFRSVEVRGRLNQALWFPRLLFEVDRVIQVPKLKTHTFVGLSVAVKNLVGLLPGATKCELHVRLPRPQSFAEGLLDIQRALVEEGVGLAGAVVDGVWALARKGSWRGPKMRPTNVVVASNNLTAADLVCASILQRPLESVPTLSAASRRALGPTSLSEIEMLGEGALLLRDSAGVRSFEPATPSWKDRARLLHQAHYYLRSRLVRPVHDPNRCCGTQACVQVCPVQCLELQGKRLRIGSSCIRCYACEAVCPKGALRLRVPWLLRRTFAKHATGVSSEKVLW